MPLDGLITTAEQASPSLIDRWKRLQIPVITIGSEDPAFSSVCVHPDSTAELAYCQLSPEHQQSIAFISMVGDTKLEKSIQQRSQRDGASFRNIELGINYQELGDVCPRPCDRIRKFLDEFSCGGIITSCDLTAIYIRRVAKRLGLDVPGRLAIVSSRDSLVCGLPSISVTAVVEPSHELGWEAAKLLDHQMKNNFTSLLHRTVKAYDVVQRDTTVPMQYEPSIARAVHYIQHNVGRNISVSDVLEFQSVSRVTFERRFRTAVGCPPGEFIRQEKLKLIKERLLQSREPIVHIAKNCGFESLAKFSTFFKNAEGVSPSHFRVVHLNHLHIATTAAT